MKNVARRGGLSLGIALLGAACAFVAVGCGGSSGSAAASLKPATTTTSGTTSTASNAGNSFAAYRSCLASHGVKLPAGGFRARGTTGAGTARPAQTAVERKAAAACASLRPSGGFRGGGFANNPAFAKYRTCLQQHGVTLGGGGPGGPGANRSSSAFQKAAAACASLRPAGGFGFGAAPPGSNGGSGANPATFQRFQACLRQHGVQLGSAGQSSAKTQAAIAACRSVLPSGGTSTTTTTTTPSG